MLHVGCYTCYKKALFDILKHVSDTPNSYHPEYISGDIKPGSVPGPHEG